MISLGLPRLTIFGRSLLLVVAEVLANAVCWIVAGVLFGRSRETQPILSLALLAWTLGLRHALDADHISAIDNATRGLINLGQLPVTCGLFFSLGHSTIVIVVNIAIAISTDVYDKMTGVGEVGGIVGAAVSGTFLFLVGTANSIILWRILKQRRKHGLQRAAGLDPAVEAADDPKHTHMLMMRIIGPVINFVDKPWKMYPVGICSALVSFDTASSIALLAISALAKRDSNGEPIPAHDIVILPFLFTSGMTMIDSLDSILMLYSYSGFPEDSFVIFEKLVSLPEDETACATVLPSTSVSAAEAEMEEPTKGPHDLQDKARALKVKLNMMSGLSIVLTLMSIFVAFSISLITIMGLIGENCGKCQEAVEAENGGGLSGSWWRAWARANDNSGYIGAAIVGSFIIIVAGWYGGRWVARKYHRRSERVVLH
ncbi:high-affinity nickel-transport protein-domain-containing protein [Mucidula mucida]|nr:high-affinity nickel-transport protein-domain-containing protein [Mucidula mucida]